MRSTKYISGLSIAAGILIAASAASAQDWRDYQPSNPPQYQNAPEYSRNPYYAGNAYDRIEELQQHIVRDRARLDEAIRCGRDADAARQAADLARDQQLLREQMRAVSWYAHYRSGRPYSRAWSYGWNWR